MKKIGWLDRHLKSHFYGILAGDYSKMCHLYFQDINNFIQNVGRFSDVEIVRFDCEVLLNTKGVLIDRIWPELSWYDREGVTEYVNYVAAKLGEVRKKDGTAPVPLPKVNKFMKEVFGQEIVDQNMEIVKSIHEEEMKEGMMELTMK